MATEDSLRRDIRAQFGLHLSPQGLHAVLEDFNDEDSKTNQPLASLSPSAVFTAAVDHSFKGGFTEPMVPEDLSSRKNLPGLVCLQIISSSNASCPSDKQDKDSTDRLLVMVLSDGYTKVHACEKIPCPSLSLRSLIPGMKIVLQNVAVGHSVLLLHPSSIVGTYGKVESLYESWKLRQDTAAVRSLLRAFQPGEQRPPAFVPFSAASSRLSEQLGKAAISVVSNPRMHLQEAGDAKKDDGRFFAPNVAVPEPVLLPELQKAKPDKHLEEKVLPPVVAEVAVSEQKRSDKQRTHAKPRGATQQHQQTLPQSVEQPSLLPTQPSSRAQQPSGRDRQKRGQQPQKDNVLLGQSLQQPQGQSERPQRLQPAENALPVRLQPQPRTIAYETDGPSVSEPRPPLNIVKFHELSPEQQTQQQVQRAAQQLESSKAPGSPLNIVKVHDLQPQSLPPQYSTSQSANSFQPQNQQASRQNLPSQHQSTYEQRQHPQEQHPQHPSQHQRLQSRQHQPPQHQQLQQLEQNQPQQPQQQRQQQHRQPLQRQQHQQQKDHQPQQHQPQQYQPEQHQPHQPQQQPQQHQQQKHHQPQQHQPQHQPQQQPQQQQPQQHQPQQHQPQQHQPQQRQPRHQAHQSQHHQSQPQQSTQHQSTSQQSQTAGELEPLRTLDSFLSAPLGTICGLNLKIQSTHLNPPSQPSTPPELQFVLEDQQQAVIIATAAAPLQSQLLGPDVEVMQRTEAGRGRVRFKIDGLSTQLRNKGWTHCTLQSAEAPPQFGGQAYFLLSLT